MNGKEGSGQPRSVTTEENTNLNEELICSQKAARHIHTIFVNKNGVNVNKENYCKHLKNSCFLQLKNLICVMTGYLSKIVFRHIDQIWYKISWKKL